MKLCRHYTVFGRVQGVNYRSFLIEEAEKNKITGWGRNVSTGEVEVLGCGTEQNLETFEQALKKGPLVANVTSIEKANVEFKKFSDFFILKDK